MLFRSVRVRARARARVRVRFRARARVRVKFRFRFRMPGKPYLLTILEMFISRVFDEIHIY